MGSPCPGISSSASILCIYAPCLTFCGILLVLGSLGRCDAGDVVFVMVIILTCRRGPGPSWLSSHVPVGGSRFRATTAQFSPTVSTCVVSRSSVMRYTRTYDCPATRCGNVGQATLSLGSRRAAWQALGARKRDAAKRQGPARRARQAELGRPYPALLPAGPDLAQGHPGRRGRHPLPGYRKLYRRRHTDLRGRRGGPGAAHDRRFGPTRGLGRGRFPSPEQRRPDEVDLLPPATALRRRAGRARQAARPLVCPVPH